MIWTGFSSTKRISIAFCQPKMNSNDYQNLMAEHLLPFWLHPDEIIQFIKKKMPKFTNQNATNWTFIMDWSVCPPNLNLIENLRGILARRVYTEGKRFGSVQN